MSDSKNKNRTDDKSNRKTGTTAKLKELLNDVKIQTFIKHSLLALILLILIFGIGVRSLNYQAKKYSEEWLKSDIENLQSAKSLTFSDAFKSQEKIEKDRLEAQYQDIRNRAQLHLNVMIYYYSRYYMAITLATICGLIAAVSLLFISKSGWSNSSSYINMIFIIAICSSVFYGAFPALFKQKENIEQNKNLYIKYAALENRILSYVATGNNSLNNDASIKDFIITLDQQLAGLHSIPLELDSNAIPELSEVLKKIETQVK